MDRTGQIKELIRQIGGARSTSLFTAEVVSVQGDTCTVKANTLILSDVKLREITTDTTHLLRITPTVGSNVLIADLGGELRDLAVIQFSDVDKINSEKLIIRREGGRIEDRVGEVARTCRCIIDASTAQCRVATEVPLFRHP